MCRRSEVNRTFSDKVVANAARASKRIKFLTPLFLLLAGTLILAHRFFMHFVSNGKRYITILLCLVFFFISSSFAFPDELSEDEIYLNSVADNVSVASVDTITVENIKGTDESEIEWIEDSDIVSNDLATALSYTDDIETFTIDDFYGGTILEKSSVADTSSFDKDAWNLVLVNKTHPILPDYEVPLATISGSMKCDERVKDILITMLSDAKKDNVSLMVCSPYRDYQLQTTLFERKINLYMSKGLSYIDAYKEASRLVTVPGASEHQIGLAFDIVTPDHATLDYQFGDTAAGIWLKENGMKYGFILRYPRGKEYVTGIDYEPWHFRYVGVEAATYIMENDITLEEFIEELQ